MKIIALGAEAKLVQQKKGSRKVLLKKRVRKSYREKSLDARIRKERTKIESSLLRKAKAAGVNTPRIFKTDLEKGVIEMEFLEGSRLKDVLSEKNLHCCLDIGRNIAKMHSQGLIHGDLTTSNIIVFKGGLFFIDFGLGFHSSKVEDLAVDVLNFKKTFMATHSSVEEGWKLIIRGYEEGFPRAKEVLGKMEEVEKRARYH